MDKETIKTREIQLIPCKVCGKYLSYRTLRYTHDCINNKGRIKLPDKIDRVKPSEESKSDDPIVNLFNTHYNNK